MRSASGRMVLAVFALALVVFAQYGALGWLGRDGALSVYAGQQFAEGVAPYESVFDNKGPLAAFFSGFAVVIGRELGVPDLPAVRAAFLLVSAAAVAAVFLFSAALLRDRHAGFLSAAVMTGFLGFGQHALSGPRAKTPMVLFAALSLWLITTRRWLWAGLAASLATLAWQPTAIFGLAALAAALLQERGVAAKWRAAAAVCGGALLPLAAVIVYFAAKGALVEFFDGFVLFNLLYVDRTGETLGTRLDALGYSLFKSYRPMGALIVIGLATVLASGFTRLRAKGFVDFARDPWAPVLATLLLATLLSLVDFQSYPDFFVFLPFAALGAGLVLRRAAGGFATASVDRGGEAASEGRGQRVCLALCALLVVASVCSYRLHADTRLVRQARQAARIADAVPAPDRILSLGAPEWLVLTKRRHIDPYVFVIAGIDRQIEARYPGGFDAWMRSLEAQQADVVVTGSTWMGREHMRRFDEWLGRHYTRLRVGDWTLQVRKGRPELFNRLSALRGRSVGRELGPLGAGAD